MRDRKGIIFIAFDLPMESSEDKAVYRKFHSFLIKTGYIMFQESVYYKIIINTLQSSKEINTISLNSPKKGNIIALPLTLNELCKLRTIRGSGIDMEELTEDVFFY